MDSISRVLPLSLACWDRCLDVSLFEESVNSVLAAVVPSTFPSTAHWALHDMLGARRQRQTVPRAELTLSCCSSTHPALVAATRIQHLVSHYSAIGDTFSCDAPYSAIGFRGKLCLRYPPSKSSLSIARGHFPRKEVGV